MSAPVVMPLYVTASVKIGGEYITGATVHFFKQGQPAFWNGLTGTRSGVYTEWVEITQHGLRAGDTILAQASKPYKGHNYAELLSAVVQDNPEWQSGYEFRFRWQFISPAPSSVTITFNVRDDVTSQVIEGVEVAYYGVETKFTDGFGAVSFSVPQGQQQVKFMFKHPSYMKVNVNVVPDVDKTLEQRLLPVGIVINGPTPGLDVSNVQEFVDEYLSWTNIAKAGAVVVLVGFGSKAFKEFKEAFKK